MNLDLTTLLAAKKGIGGIRRLVCFWLRIRLEAMQGYGGGTYEVYSELLAECKAWE